MAADRPWVGGADEANYPLAELVQPELTQQELDAALTVFSPDYINCTACHIQGDQFTPRTRTAERPTSRCPRSYCGPTWIIDWLADPQSLILGTRMPAFYPLGASDVLAEAPIGGAAQLLA